jgi:small-conductance mechanosensitive channel
MNFRQAIDIAGWIAINAALIGCVAILALVAHRLLIGLLLRLAKRTRSQFDERVVLRCRAPSRWILLAATIWISLDFATFPPNITVALRRLISLAIMGLTIWLLVAIVRIACDVFLSRYNVSVSDNLRARAVHTQIMVFERILITVIIIIGFGCILMTFDGVRQLGVSLLASAGIAGIVLGLAAQRVLGTFFAGLQLAITQPIRLEDVVIVEGEWGVIEEITLTYVVVRIWDLRRLVVPATYFIEKPFQNWTRTSASILGTVFLHADYTLPVDPIRQRLHDLLKASPEWDGQVWGLQVTNVTDRSMELRALMGARNASDAWNLRCHIREQLLKFIGESAPAALPRLRVASDSEKQSLSNGNGAAGGDPTP